MTRNRGPPCRCVVQGHAERNFSHRPQRRRQDNDDLLLTGMLEPTAGEFTVSGYLEYGTSDLQAHGFCPQHDILRILTAAEHVEMFARLKGAPTIAPPRRSARPFWRPSSSRNARTSCVRASGGMRRKVCVALSLTGDTKFVVLDEPSAGLDPGARRRLWQTLATLKEGRASC